MHNLKSHINRHYYIYVLYSLSGLPGGSVIKNLPVSAGDAGSIPGSGRSPGEGYGNPLQDPCLGNPMDRGAWQGPWGCKRVGHDLATKQEQICIFKSYILFSICSFLKAFCSCFMGRMASSSP